MSDGTPDDTKVLTGLAAVCADDTQLRAFLVKYYGASAYDIDGRVFVKNLDIVFDWVKSGKTPTKGEWKKRSVALSTITGSPK